jgi:hypothetical protein
MAYTQQNGDISMFRNKKKTADNQPDMKGTAIIDGVKYQVAMWTKGTKPDTFLAGKIEVDTYKYKDRDESGPPPAANPDTMTPNQPELPEADDSDSLPF